MDGFDRAQAHYDAQVPAYLEAGVCEDCGSEDCYGECVELEEGED